MRLRLHKADVLWLGAVALLFWIGASHLRTYHDSPDGGMVPAAGWEVREPVGDAEVTDWKWAGREEWRRKKLTEGILFIGLGVAVMALWLWGRLHDRTRPGST